LFDGGGLNLLVTKAGGKLWRLKFTHEGRTKQLALGTYPAVTLAEARFRREEASGTPARRTSPVRGGACTASPKGMR
ncbi:MAG: DUF4102 domain-containing protein, partial [Deltaproteobacteria bacterium]|nr:DUF4102 domain-containing protein [Deltaproteobacteria bacterium]